MTFERIPSPNHPLYADAMALYGISFPAHEQRETPSQTAILTHPDYHFTAILDGSAFVGDMLYWETPDFRYIEHFCILPALRGQRYGSRALSMLPCDRPVILETRLWTKSPSAARASTNAAASQRTRIRMCIRRTTRAFMGMICC